jgi:4-amino-4-deoxy-L-arabinose transferase-like glycosyltransferase
VSRLGSPRVWARIALVFLCLLVRLVALGADPPPWLSWSTGLYTDEGYYTLDARHEALFGTLAPGDFHDRLLSPLLSLIQQGVFEVFGAGLLQARLLCVLFGLLTIAVFWLGLRRAYDDRTADFGALFLGVAPPFALYNRLALQETPTVFWLVLAFTLWAYGIKWVSGAALAAAIVFKGLAIVALPVLLVRVSPAPNNGGVRAEKTAPLSSYLTPPLLGAGEVCCFTSRSGTGRTTANFPGWRRTTRSIKCSRIRL